MATRAGRETGAKGKIASWGEVLHTGWEGHKFGCDTELLTPNQGNRIVTKPAAQELEF